MPRHSLALLLQFSICSVSPQKLSSDADRCRSGETLHVFQWSDSNLSSRADGCSDVAAFCFQKVQLFLIVWQYKETGNTGKESEDMRQRFPVKSNQLTTRTFKEMHVVRLLVPFPPFLQHLSCTFHFSVWIRTFSPLTKQLPQSYKSHLPLKHISSNMTV